MKNEMNNTIKFHIPDFYNFNKVNQYIIDLLKDFPKYFYDNISIGSIYGSFPNAVWNGGRPCIDDTFHKDNIVKIIEQFNGQGIPLRYTFTNSKLVEKHLSDEYCNEILKMSDNGFNEIIVHSPLLENYLRKIYPNFKYILSTTVALRGADNINKACEKYDMIILDYNDNKNWDMLDKLEFKDKIEFLVNESCMPNCRLRKNHYDAISQQQLDKCATNYFNCPLNESANFNPLLRESPTIITENELYETYAYQMGFRNFKLQGRGYPEIVVLLNCIAYMIKPEYKDIFYSKIVQVEN